MAASTEINSVIKACDVIACIVDGTHGISEISRKLGYSKSSVFKILNSFTTKGFVTKDPITRKYYIGPFLQNMTIDLVSVHQILVQSAIDEIKKLSSIVEKSAALQIPYGMRRFVVCAVQHTSGINFFSNLGIGAPLYTGAASKILLSQYGEKELNAMLDRFDYHPFSPNTPKNKNDLFDDIVKAKKQGYAIGIAEHAHKDAAALAVPINNYSCPVALGVSGIESHILEKKEMIINNLRESAEIISQRLDQLLHQNEGKGTGDG